MRPPMACANEPRSATQMTLPVPADIGVATRLAGLTIRRNASALNVTGSAINVTANAINVIERASDIALNLPCSWPSSGLVGPLILQKNSLLPLKNSQSRNLGNFRLTH